VRAAGGAGEGVDTEAPSLLSYTLRYVSLTELVNVWSSLLSYTLRYVSLAELGNVCQVEITKKC
jgi:hypothetical protein